MARVIMLIARVVMSNYGVDLSNLCLIMFTGYVIMLQNRLILLNSSVDMSIYRAIMLNARVVMSICDVDLSKLYLIMFTAMLSCSNVGLSC